MAAMVYNFVSLALKAQTFSLCLRDSTVLSETNQFLRPHQVSLDKILALKVLLCEQHELQQNVKLSHLMSGVFSSCLLS